MSDVCKAADCQKVTLMGLLDLSAAIDCVDHPILLQHLSLTFGICRAVLDWVRSFLTGRTQQVSYGGRMYSIITLLCGVP